MKNKLFLVFVLDFFTSLKSDRGCEVIFKKDRAFVINAKEKIKLMANRICDLYYANILQKLVMFLWQIRIKVIR